MREDVGINADDLQFFVAPSQLGSPPRARSVITYVPTPAVIRDVRSSWSEGEAEGL